MPAKNLSHLVQLIANDGHAASFQSLGQYRQALLKEISEAIAAPCTTTSDQYRAELYDEMFEKARSMGFGNIIGALTELERLRVENTRLGNQRDAILLQARVWAGEAKTQQAITREVGEILGGVPNWGPITAGVEAMRQQLKAAQAENSRLRGALKFYADSEHYHFESDNWDSVSGEPSNILWHSDDPDFIEDGEVARAALSASAEPVSHNVYVTQPGEMIAGIALRQLGAESRWPEIADLNAGEWAGMGPNDMYPPGTKLRIPAKGGDGEAV